MKKILFTKSLDNEYLASKLSEQLQFESESFIDFTTKKVQPFIIENKSIIFTSINGVKSFFDNGFKLNDTHYIYSVGSKTEKLLSKYGFKTQKTLPNAKDLAQYLKENGEEQSFIHFCGNLSLDIFKEVEANYRKVVVYETHFLYPKINFTYDAVAFFSPSAVKSYIKNNQLDNLILFSIGETTSKEIRKYTKNTIFTSSKNTLEDVLELINQELK